MRRVVRSKTAAAQLKVLLEQGAQKFGWRVADAKLAVLDRTLEQFLAVYPKTKQLNRRLGLRIYPVSDTPFVVLYDFDDEELRVHFIFHQAASLRNLDPGTVEW